MYVHAFGLLNRTRSVNMARSAITLSDIKAYCDLYQVQDREAFTQIITAMDAGYLEYLRDEEGKGE